MTPRVSVLLPAFDAGQTLASCLRSLQRQSEPRWECVLVDDGSGDDTLAIARAFAAGDARLRVVDGGRRGLVESLNAGLALCRAPIVARMDADDWMHRERMAAQLARLEQRPELSGLGCRVRVFPRRGLSEGRRSYESWLNGLSDSASVRADAFVECPIAHPTLMMRRERLVALGYRDRGWPEDYDLVLRLLAAGDELEVLPRRLVGWRDGPGRLSRTGAAYTLERFTACKAHFLAEGLLAGQEEYVLWGYGDTGRALRRELLRNGRRPSHIVELHPGRLGNRIHGAPVIPPEALRELRGHPVVVSVAGRQPRGLIRAALEELDFREGQDFVCTA